MSQWHRQDGLLTEALRGTDPRPPLLWMLTVPFILIIDSCLCTVLPVVRVLSRNPERGLNWCDLIAAARYIDKTHSEITSGHRFVGTPTDVGFVQPP